MTALLFSQVEVGGRGHVDCRVRDGVITEVGQQLTHHRGEHVIYGNGGALLPGLADHHLHLAAMAAQRDSVDLTALPPDEVVTAIATARQGRDGWVRAVGYDDAHGDLDREALDRWRSDVSVRVQHRSGALWVLNTAGLLRVNAESASHPGIECDHSGRPTGRLWRADDWLRSTIDAPPPSLAPVGRLLASFGVTHVSDATPGDAAGPFLIDAVARGELPQKVTVMGTTLGSRRHARVTLGPYKIVIPDHEAPDLAALIAQISRAHADLRPVALHCVTRTGLAVALAAFDTTGVLTGDRIEHCAVADLPTARLLAERGIRVVTQPTLVARRGDAYWDRTDDNDRSDLWRYAGLLDAGVQVAPSSDAPYGDPDPWACLRAARDRKTPSGRVLGTTERVPPETTLRGLLSPPGNAGGPPREIHQGCPADLVLLDRPLPAALAEPDARCVRATMIDGQVVHQR